MGSHSLQMKMNILGLVQSQKTPMAEAMMPNLFAAIRKPSVACGPALTAYPLAFAKKANGGRIEELVHPHYILRTGLS
jgi:hypothetical protein